jgi:hypothetical protein
MIVRRVVGAALFVLCSSAFFYGVEKFMSTSKNKWLVHDTGEDAKRIRFSVTNNLNEGISHAIIYLVNETGQNRVRDFRFTGETGEAILPKLPDGKYTWKVVTIEDSIVSTMGSLEIRNQIPSSTVVSVVHKKTIGN